MATAPWQEELRQRLVERNARESAYSEMIEQYRRLAQQARLLKERNQSLLRAVSTARTNPNVAGSAEDSAVQAAYIASLESQVSSLRDEMAAVYKTQGQNAQRLLAMNESLRDKEEVARVEAENLRKAREEIAVLRKKVEQHDELMSEKDRGIQILHDEIQSLNLELNQVTNRNESLKVDNASLLQRWLDHMNEAATRMNSANLFYEDMVNKGWKTDSQSGRSQSGQSGNGSVNGEDPFQKRSSDSAQHPPGNRRQPNG
jgi:autophagy-related protein 16